MISAGVRPISRATILLNTIKRAPTSKNISKYIKNVTEVKNKNIFMFFKKPENDFSSYSQTHRDLLSLKYCVINPGNYFPKSKYYPISFSEKKSAVIDKAIVKNLNKIIKKGPEIKFFNQTIDHSKMGSVNDYLAIFKTAFDSPKMNISESSQHGYQSQHSTISEMSSTSSFDEIIGKYDRLLKYYNSISIDETESASVTPLSSVRDSRLSYGSSEKFFGITFNDFDGNQYTRF